tara:strand:+ start:1137 stop:1688 length:552 start_codon:yes stop_codon:yes gene_type:complete
MSQESKLPGEKIAFSEEYLSGENTFDDGELVRSSVIGQTEFNKEERTVSIHSNKSISIPKIGDIVIGLVEASLGSLIAVSMQYINNIKVTSNVECICTTRHMRKKNVALVKDVVKLKIINHINGTIHASMDDRDLGVLFTKCRKCFGEVIQTRDAVKCKDCGWIDDRKLSSDFGKADFLKQEI